MIEIALGVILGLFGFVFVARYWDELITILGWVAVFAFFAVLFIISTGG